MITENIVQKIALPEGISATVEGSVVSLTGPKGTVSRNFIHPKVKVSLDQEGISFTAIKFTKNEKKVMHTYVAHLKNLFKGVTKGHEYKLKICSGHFPMNVSIKGQTLEVKNFIGEVVPRSYSFSKDVDVKLNGEMISVTGINKELVSQTAGSIEQLTRRVGFDRRIFQDGIYIVDKDGKLML
jgi:large subunit ribosomal protein L6